nr:immunoglobulin heavy chain junction region [Macaca mulatta]MOY19698.1 immunoglobulin heavy chain junction region [Macaca mulatta]MOY19699.1 immunoglobulin heavy chain junction region [Macaca mulatta]MOY20035.1 immunoglobulin heavy chain junction region [Macaca mulatta]MOY20650.1 immunoglobulin heavy chain junction region [Macaca mulatta]
CVRDNFSGSYYFSRFDVW